MAGLMRQSRGYWPHFAALGYAGAGYAGGLWLLTLPFGALLRSYHRHRGARAQRRCAR